MHLSDLHWAKPSAPSPAMLSAQAMIRRAAREAVHAAVVSAIRAMVDRPVEFNRVQPGLSNMLPLDRAEHCADLWRERRKHLTGYAHPVFGQSDAVNLRAARAAAWIIVRQERRAAKRTAA